MRWKDDWLKELSILKGERTAIQVGVLTRAPHYLGTYDQLNCPCLAGAEALCQRLSQLIDAYASGDTGRPSYKHLSTYVVPVSLKSYAHRKAKEEHDTDCLRHEAGGGGGRRRCSCSRGLRR